MPRHPQQCELYFSQKDSVAVLVARDSIAHRSPAKSFANSARLKIKFRPGTSKVVHITSNGMLFLMARSDEKKNGRPGSKVPNRPLR